MRHLGHRMVWFSSVVVALGLACGTARGSEDGGRSLLDSLTRPIEGRAMRASSGEFDPESNRDAHHPMPGQRLVIADLEGPGEIRHIWFTIASRDRRYPRSLVLRIFWDGSDVPSVETPIGDFFAAGNGMRANVTSLPIEVTSYGRALNTYWPMPFRRRAVVEVHNEGKERTTVYAQIDWLKRPVPDDALYFHARYRQEYPAKPFSWYTIFDGKGEGQYVGTVFSSQNTVASWFGEADDRYYIDGEAQPSLVGTGTEDFFNDAWNLRLFSTLRRGVTICETKGEERRITAFRWQIDDPVPFRKSLKVEIERRSFIQITDPATGVRSQYDFKYRPDYVSSVAFWYQKGIAEPFCPFPPVELRVLPEVWVEVAEMADQVKAAPGLSPRRASNRTCNLKRMFYMRNDAVGGWVEFPVKLDVGGRYAVSVFQSLYEQYGVWKVSLLAPGFEEVLDPALDFHDLFYARNENWPENFHHGTTVEKKVGTYHLKAGEYVVRFECVGSNPQSRHPETGEFGKGFSLGLDAILFRLLPIDEPKKWIEDYLAKEKALFARWETEARSTVNALAAGIEAARLEKGAYPRALADIVPRVPEDPWRQPYGYRMPGEVNPWSYDVWSAHGETKEPALWIGNWSSPYRAPGAIEGEDLTVARASEGVRGSVQRIASYGTAPISGGTHLFISLDRPGAWAEIPLPESVKPGRYEAYLFVVTSWDYGIGRWSIAGTPIGGAFDGHSPTIARRALPRTILEIEPNARTIRVEITGKDPRSAGYKAGLDAIVLRPVR
ncbi:MAG: DUF2961 domain-containing protein [Planctomycetes bacterium]|nr:DUF2961 domain-containing protein [Planctomycetota bacterium]